MSIKKLYNMDNRLSIYISSPDSYSDVFELFYKCFRKYWSNCPYEFILTTNSQKYDGIHCICNHKPGDTWVERTLAASDEIKSKYVLLMCDDLLINDYVKTDMITKILDYMDKYDIRYCRLEPLRTKKIVKDFSTICYVNKQRVYGINLQIGIFRKDFFTELLCDGTQSAWDIENKLNCIAANNDVGYYTDIIAVTEPVISYIHGVYKGEWISEAKKYIVEQYPDYIFRRRTLSFRKNLKIQIMDYLIKCISPRTRRYLKYWFTKTGVSFVTEK